MLVRLNKNIINKFRIIGLCRDYYRTRVLCKMKKNVKSTIFSLRRLNMVYDVYKHLMYQSHETQLQWVFFLFEWNSDQCFDGITRQQGRVQVLPCKIIVLFRNTRLKKMKKWRRQHCFSSILQFQWTKYMQKSTCKFSNLLVIVDKSVQQSWLYLIDS